MELAAHLAFERLVDDLVLLHPRLAPKRLRHHRGGIVVTVTGEIADRHLGVRDARLDQALDLVRIHRHGRVSSGFRCPRLPYRRGTSARMIRAALPPRWGAHPRASMRPLPWSRADAPKRRRPAHGR